MLGKSRLTQVLPLYSQLKMFSIGISPEFDNLFKLSQRLFKSKSVLEKDFSKIFLIWVIGIEWCFSSKSFIKSEYELNKFFGRCLIK